MSKKTSLSDADRKRARASYQLAWHAKRQRMCIDYLGGKCVVSGTEIDLECHHKDPGKKSFNPSHDNRSWVATVAELDKCELRCVECHKDVHATSHGQLRMYQFHKRRCEPCVLAMREWRRAYQKSDRYKEWARDNKKKKYWQNPEGFLVKQRAWRRGS